MILLTLHSQGALVSATPGGYSEAVRQVMFDMPGVVWDKAAKHYIGHPDAILTASSMLAAARVVKLRDARAARSLATRRWQASDLRPYQAQGVAWLVEQLAATGGAMLCDEMGLGKSAQALRAALALGVDEILIVCPAIVVRHWAAQLERWAVGLKATVMGYERFRIEVDKPFALVELAKDAKLAIIDEIHYAANPNSKRSKALRTWLHDRRIYRLGLSGTPIQARPRDLWHPAELLWPGRFGRVYSFQKRYCDGHYEEIRGLDKAVWKAEGKSNVEELAKRLEYGVLRRTKAEVGDELPALSREVIEVEVSASVRDLFDRAQLAALGDSSASGYDMAVSSLLSSIEAHKVPEALQLARDILATGGRPLVLTTRKASAQQLASELGCPYATGDVTPDKRRDRIANAECAIATIDSVQVGIDLIGFDYVIFVGLDWLPSKLLQAEARTHRLGADKHKPITVYYLIALETVEEVIRERVIDRLATFEALLGDPGHTLQSDLRGAESEEDLLNAIVMRLRGEAT